jgi:glycosyltransferase involved in cell wall biosynthesis
MKILLVQPAVSPSKGGAQWNTVRLAVELARRDHTVRVVGEFRSVPEMARMLDDVDVSISAIPIHGKGFASILKLVGELRRFRPDVVHSCLRSGDVAAAVSALPFRTPVVSTVGEKLPTVNDERNGQGWRGALHKLLLRRAFRAVGATSEFSRKHLVAYSGITSSKVHVIPNGIDTEQFAATDSPTQIPEIAQSFEGKKLVGIVGRIAPEKRVELLPDLIQDLVDRGINAAGVIVGKGICENDVRAKVERTPISDRIVFLGNCADMKSIYNRLDVLVHFGSVEGFGLAMAEAMACGLPVVAANAGGSAEIIENGIDGFLVDPESIGQYADKITELMNDQAVYDSISKNARSKILTEFSMQRFVDRYERMYADAIGTTRA